MEGGFAGLDFRVQPAVAGVAEVAAGALGDELADLGYEGHAECFILLQLVEGFLHFHGRRPSAVPMCPGEIVGSDHEVVDGARDADGACGVLFLLLGESQGDDDARWSVPVGAGGFLLVALFLHRYLGLQRSLLELFNHFLNTFRQALASFWP